MFINILTIPHFATFFFSPSIPFLPNHNIFILSFCPKWKTFWTNAWQDLGQSFLISVLSSLHCLPSEDSGSWNNAIVVAEILLFDGKIFEWHFLSWHLWLNPVKWFCARSPNDIRDVYHFWHAYNELQHNGNGQLKWPIRLLDLTLYLCYICVLEHKKFLKKLTDRIRI